MVDEPDAFEDEEFDDDFDDDFENELDEDLAEFEAQLEGQAGVADDGLCEDDDSEVAEAFDEDDEF